jgi:DNA-binding Lrp family transcriptional regulator
MNIDEIDRAILDVLQRDGRIPNVRLASLVGLSESACLRRTRALEDAGVITRYVAVVDPQSVGLPGNVFVHIALNKQDQVDLDAFEEAVRDIPEVIECFLMTGEFDYLVHVVVADAADYERIHRSRLTPLPGVARVQSSFALRAVKSADGLPLIEPTTA